MAVDYNDNRLTAVETEKSAALSDVEKTYDNMINTSDGYYQAQIDAAKDYAQTQTQLQQEQTDFAIEKIEQEKEQAKKDYTKEQSGAYVDWQKQSNKYGANAEQMAASGLTNSGYSESSQVSMYNTYQNRIATARESYNQAVQNYNNSITEARMQNNTVLAEIAYNALQQQLELSLQGFQYKNSLVTEKLNQKTTVENSYWSRYQDVLNQINTENALAEQQRQFDANLALQQQQLAQEQAQWEKEYALQQQQSQASQAAIAKPDGSLSIGTGSGEYSTTITTDYFSGTIPLVTQRGAANYGVFANGYQPKGIMGYGEVKKSGKTEWVSTTTLSGQKRSIEQNIWVTPDGSEWIWDGRNMKYVPA